MKGAGQNTFLLILLVIGLVVTVVSITTYGWLFAKVGDTASRATITAEEAQLLATKNAHTQTVRRVVRDTQTQRQQLDSYFVTEPEFVSFLEEIESLGASAGAPIQVQSVGIGKPIDKDELVVPLELDLRSEGTLRGVFHVLTLLEAYPKVMHVRSARITQHPTDLNWVGAFNVEVIQVNTSGVE